MILLLFSLMTVTGCGQTASVNPEMTGNTLPGCPDRPNCVSSQAVHVSRQIAPFTFNADKDRAFTALVNILTSWPRTRIVEKSDHYIHVVCTSRIFQFKDDVQFFFPRQQGIIHVRSASRVGYSDLGVNRKRLEALRKAFHAELAL